MSHPLVPWKNVYREVAGIAPASVRRLLPRTQGPAVSRVATLDEIDVLLARAEEIFASSEDAARSFLAGFELVPPRGLPRDPFSTAYRDAVLDLYLRVSRRAEYTTNNEQSVLEVAEARRRPFPYSTGSSTIVGDQLIARGFLVKALGLEEGARLVEFGAGWGNVTVDFATMGIDVTVVEVERRFAELIVERGANRDNLHVVIDDMLAFECEAPFDVALFFESFHHCSDHIQMLERLHDIVKPSGMLAFAAEPVMKMPYPWGLRLDGLSLWSTRRFGWLELGFDTKYFFEALRRTGWRAERVRSESICPLTDVILATPA